MRIANSIAWLTLGALATMLCESELVSAALVNVPTLYSCQAADIRVLAKGNYTIEGRDSESHKLVFRARVDKNVNLVTWDAVDLAPNATAVITVTDQVGRSATQTALVTATAVVQANPTGNTTCLHQADRDHGSATTKQKNMVPTIIGIALGAFFLLVMLLVGGMMYRRKKEKDHKFENESLDLNHGLPQGSVPAGGSYMQRLVPGLKMHDAKPLPRDPVLESEQANYASTRRGTQYYRNESPGLGANGFELPSYGQSQRFSNNPRSQSPTSAYYRGYADQQMQQQWNTPHSPQLHNSQLSPARQDQYSSNPNPFASQPDLLHHSPSNQRPHAQHVYQHNDYAHSQNSFLSKNNSQ